MIRESVLPGIEPRSLDSEQGCGVGAGVLHFLLKSESKSPESKSRSLKNLGLHWTQVDIV